jgi:hypothetical protein
MELNKSKLILSQKQEDSLTGAWITVENALLNKPQGRSGRDHYGALVLVVTATLSLKGSWGDLMLTASLISTAHIDVGAAVVTTTARGARGTVETPFSTAFTACIDGGIESDARLYDGLLRSHENKTRSHEVPV